MGVIELNNHRLMNGDATSKDDVSELIGDCKVNLLLTDPPYGINIVNTVGGGSMEMLAHATSIQVSSSKERERERALEQSVEQNHQHSKVGTVGTPARPGFKRERANDKNRKGGCPRRCTTKTLQTSNRR